MNVRVHLPWFCLWGTPALVACVGWIAVLATIDPSGSYPHAVQGPGLTIDETFNVQTGVFLSEAIRAYGLGILHREREEVFGHQSYNPDHPPLGRLWIGLFHDAVLFLLPPNDYEPPFVTVCGRAASATAFALMVFLVGFSASKWYGQAAGCAAAVAVVLMPRVFGHAHLASLETFIALTYAAAILVVAHFWDSPSSPSRRTACLTGIIFGLALLTKVQAILIPPVVACWSLLYWRKKAIIPIAVWATVGMLVFWAGWPWLWLDPIDHVLEFLGRTTDRDVIYTWYFGQRYSDRDVPWHYPAVIFLTTVPIGLQLLGFSGLVCGKRRVWNQRREQLLLGSILFPLLLFGVPGVAVYDGARLFIVVFPLWALFVGRGCAWVLELLTRKYSLRTSACLLVGFVALQAYGLVTTHPCYLSYYNLLVGGLPGAQRLGMEVTYWGDSITRSFLQQSVQMLPPGETVVVTPPLHPFHLKEMLIQSPILRRHKIQLRRFDQLDGTPLEGRSKYVMAFLRKSDLPEFVMAPPPGTEIVAEVRRQGVQLSVLYKFPAPNQSESKPQ